MLHATWPQGESLGVRAPTGTGGGGNRPGEPANGLPIPAEALGLNAATLGPAPSRTHAIWLKFQWPCGEGQTELATDLGMRPENTCTRLIFLCLHAFCMLHNTPGLLMARFPALPFWGPGCVVPGFQPPNRRFRLSPAHRRHGYNTHGRGRVVCSARGATGEMNGGTPVGK